MGSGIGNRIAHKIVRQMRRGRVAKKRKLKDPHTRKRAVTDQFRHILGNIPEVLRNDNPLLLFRNFAQGIHQRFSRSLLPVPLCGGLGIRGNAPITGKPAEMVNPDTVEQGQHV